MSDWTTANLKEFMLTQLQEIRSENDRRFASQEKAVETAFDASKEAIAKSELAVEKRSDAVYVTLSKLSDALAAVMPRAEAEQRFKAAEEKFAILKASTDTTTGRTSGMDKSWAIALGSLGGVATIIGVILAFNN